MPLCCSVVLWHLGRFAGMSAGESCLSIPLLSVPAGIAVSIHGFRSHLLEAWAVVLRSLQPLDSNNITPCYHTHSSLPLSPLLVTVPGANVRPLSCTGSLEVAFLVFIFIYIFPTFFSLC